MLRLLVWLFFLVLFLLAIAFTVPNRHSVTLHYYIGSLDAPLAVLLFSGFALGAVLSLLLSLTWIWRLRAENRRLRRQTHETRLEMSRLRAGQDAT